MNLVKPFLFFYIKFNTNLTYSISQLTLFDLDQVWMGYFAIISAKGGTILSVMCSAIWTSTVRAVACSSLYKNRNNYSDFKMGPIETIF